MRLYHGSRIGGIAMLNPRLADHDRPYIYLSTIETVAAFYLCNAVERPYYWFPYGFQKSAPGIPVYDELYPNAFREVSESVRGWIYIVEAGEADTLPFGQNPVARLGTGPLPVTEVIEIPDAYRYFREAIAAGRMALGRFEEKSEGELRFYHRMIIDHMRQKEMHRTPDCSYARFIREKFPEVWEEYISES